MLGNLLAGNTATNGNNILVAAIGAESGVAKVTDNGYNLIGYNNVAGVTPAATINLIAGSSFIGSTVTLDEIVETTLTSTGKGHIFKAIITTT
jgi:hypothetical protein